jgi:anaerobic selenocysteine-containing dehydrogenase
MVMIRSRTGSIVIEAEITVEIMKGVVSVPHGWGHGRNGVKLRVASARPGVSVNDITDERLTDDITGCAVFNGIPVSIERVG